MQPVNNKFSAIIFDFDGTLAVPTLDFARMQAKGLEALRAFVPVPQEVTRLGLEELPAKTAGLPEDTALLARRAVCRAFREVEMEAAAASGLFPFVRPMLLAMRDQGILPGIITRNCREAVNLVFPDSALLCTCLLTREDVDKVKPHPEHLQAALACLGVAPEKALMVGDHCMDIQVGKNAGTATAGVASGEHTREMLAAEQPDFLAADAGELARMLGIFS